MLQSFYEERDSPPSPAGADGAANGFDDRPKELLDSLQSGDDRDAGAASSDPRHACIDVLRHVWSQVGPPSGFMKLWHRHCSPPTYGVQPNLE